MSVIINISPLPFYDDISQQHHRKGYSYGNIFPIICANSTILPFQVPITADHGITKLSDIDEIELCSLQSSSAVDIRQSMIDTGLSVINKSSYYIIKYLGMLPISTIGTGQYYIKIAPVGNGKPLYSEVFTFSKGECNGVTITYRNSANFLINNCEIDFTNFYFRVHLDTQVGLPEYTYEEEAEERLGYTFVRQQISKKSIRFSFVAPEYLCDATRLIRLCDNKKITHDGKEEKMLSFEMSVDWLEQGDLAGVDCAYEIDNVLVNVVGIGTPGGDFNNDFSTDYDV